MKTLRELAFSDIQDLVNRHVNVFKPDDLSSRIIGEFEETRRYESVVAAHGKVGLVTIRDLLGVSLPAQTKLDSIWRITGAVSPNERVIDIAELMIQNNLRAFPVRLDARTFGIVSQVDLMKALCDVHEISSIPVKGLMRKPVVSLEVDEKVALARRLMLERGFSHIPITEEKRLVGLVTAEIIVQAFIISISKTTHGDRIGEKINRFPGLLRGVMDPQPSTVEPHANALEVARGLRDRGKSACIVVSQSGEVYGILTPRELLTLFQGIQMEGELPIYIVGLSDEDFFERGIAEEKVRRVVSRNMRIHPHIEEVSVRIKRSKTRGNKIRYEITARALSPEEQFIAEANGWELLEVFDELCDTLDKTLRRSKHKPERNKRRRRFRR